MMTIYSTLKKIAAFGFAASILAACAAPNYTSGSGSASSSAAAGGSASAKYLVENVGDRIFFATDQSILDASARGTLVRQAEWLNQNGGINLTIEGHADERGTREYNLALGARRANAVRDFLISQGVNASRVRTISFGKERPVSLCSEESCWSKNRRSVSTIR
ncbi:MAG: peptidoglycan-associated lipoprotein [Rhodobiaceae bacterium]|nr:peptidoglycan-associated lipoprotein [Rhodobiaceae bacterium]OUT93350.1 MAG: peptidoglycan-associated lipoprotein [Rhizobiales bacterium TMED29]HAL84081.1 peptidoglycan-associated lipoprotein Pal [Rhodobiaceae bacterium]